VSWRTQAPQRGRRASHLDLRERQCRQAVLPRTRRPEGGGIGGGRGGMVDGVKRSTTCSEGCSPLLLPLCSEEMSCCVGASLGRLVVWRCITCRARLAADILSFVPRVFGGAVGRHLHRAVVFDVRCTSLESDATRTSALHAKYSRRLVSSSALGLVGVEA